MVDPEGVKLATSLRLHQAGILVRPLCVLCGQKSLPTAHVEVEWFEVYGAVATICVYIYIYPHIYIYIEICVYVYVYIYLFTSHVEP